MGKPGGMRQKGQARVEFEVNGENTLHLLNHLKFSKFLQRCTRYSLSVTGCGVRVLFCEPFPGLLQVTAIVLLVHCLPGKTLILSHPPSSQQPPAQQEGFPES